MFQDTHIFSKSSHQFKRKAEDYMGYILAFNHKDGTVRSSAGLREDTYLGHEPLSRGGHDT